ncbi:MAG: type II toxin-antitoxin system RelE/ParE family toxin [Defluviitaleaceae bacterium]|nr:type II toxin-antitoxin system RelE/ParE family toxin [Defluviitaleaceae bacterium]
MKIDIRKRAEKFMSKLPKKQRERILKAILSLPQGDVAPLRGGNSFRLRIGKWRATFDIVENKITVYDIDNRGDIYK